MKLETDGVGSERAARWPRPFDRALAFLDPLFAGSAFVVEGDDILSGPRHLCHDESNTGISSPGCHSTLATTRRGFVQLPA